MLPAHVPRHTATRTLDTIWAAVRVEMETETQQSQSFIVLLFLRLSHTLTHTQSLVVMSFSKWSSLTPAKHGTRVDIDHTVTWCQIRTVNALDACGGMTFLIVLKWSTPTTDDYNWGPIIFHAFPMASVVAGKCHSVIRGIFPILCHHQHIHRRPPKWMEFNCSYPHVALLRCNFPHHFSTYLSKLIDGNELWQWSCSLRAPTHMSESFA